VLLVGYRLLEKSRLRRFGRVRVGVFWVLVYSLRLSREGVVVNVSGQSMESI